MLHASAPNSSFIFVSNMNDAPWGGSEELWAEAARRLLSDGARVDASVHGWSPPHKRIGELRRAGASIHPRRPKYGLLSRVFHKLIKPNQPLPLRDVVRVLNANRAALVVMSCTPFWLSLIEHCVENAIPFVTITQANTESFWPGDVDAEAYRRLIPFARRCYFVSKANKRLFENQIGMDLANADIVWNPFKVDRNASVPWPQPLDELELRLASVARLHPPAKGHDLLLEALAAPVWRNRRWHLSLYGEGPMRDTIERMISRFGLSSYVSIAGFVESVEAIWTQNHALVMPSRYEGMPLAMVEAMLCARPVLATDIADHSDIVLEGVTGFLAAGATVASVSEALERLWENRTALKLMGERAAELIRSKVPLDPVQDFADKLKLDAQL